MAERRNANLFEVLICEISKDGKINVVLGKALSVLPETEVLKPVRNLLHADAASPYSLNDFCSLLAGIISEKALAQ